jgi:hypothetical protein
VASGLEPQTLVQLDEGKFVWEPALQLVEFVEKGKRNPIDGWGLRYNENTRAGALRRVGKIIGGGWFD